MNYSLALKLKEAGFPYSKDLRKIFTCKCGAEINYAHERVGMEDDWVIVPTLEELIEACGEKMRQLVKLADSEYWKACGLVGETWIETAPFHTPSEAVAMLYLALPKSPQPK